MLLASDANTIARGRREHRKKELLVAFADHFERIDAHILRRAHEGEFSATYSGVSQKPDSLCGLQAEILEVYRDRGYATRLDLVTGQMNIYWSK